MPVNINDFHSQLNVGQGIMRTNRYELLIPGEHDGAFIRYWAQQVIWPGKLNVTDNVLRHGYGVIEKRPRQTNFQNVQMLFNNDNTNRVWDALHVWMSLIIPHNLSAGMRPGQFQVAYKNDYARDIHIDIYDQANQRRNRVTLVEAFPSMIQDVQLSYMDRDQPFQFAAMFDFYTWHTIYDDYNERTTTPDPPAPDRDPR